MEGRVCKVTRQTKEENNFQDDDTLSLLAHSDVEDGLQQEKDDPLGKAMFAGNDAESKSGPH